MVNKYTTVIWCEFVRLEGLCAGDLLATCTNYCTHRTCLPLATSTCKPFVGLLAYLGQKQLRSCFFGMDPSSSLTICAFEGTSWKNVDELLPWLEVGKVILNLDLMRETGRTVACPYCHLFNLYREVKNRCPACAIASGYLSWSKKVLMSSKKGSFLATSSPMSFQEFVK